MSPLISTNQAGNVPGGIPQNTQPPGTPTGGGGGLSAFTSPGETINIGGTLTAPTVDLASPVLKLPAASAHARAEADESITGNSGFVTFTFATSPQVTNAVVIPSVVGGAKNPAAPWIYEGWDTTVYGNIAVVPLQGTVNGSRVYSAQFPFQIIFDFDGVSFDINFVSPGGGGSIRIWANEIATTYETIANGLNTVLNVSFGTRAQRRIIIEADYGLYFKGINHAETESIMPPSRQSGGLKVAYVGDSYSVGNGINAANGSGLYPSAQGYPFVLSRLLGITEHRVYGIPGTGFVQSAGNAANYLQRIADVLAYQPDLVLLQGSIINDGTGYVAGTIQPQIATYVAQLRAGLPATSKIIAHSGGEPVLVSTRSSPVSTDYIAAFAAAGIPYIDGYTLGANGGWNYGTGRVGSPTGDGNADYYHSQYYLGHPSLAGHDYAARRLAGQLALLLPTGI